MPSRTTPLVAALFGSAAGAAAIAMYVWGLGAIVVACTLAPAALAAAVDATVGRIPDQLLALAAVAPLGVLLVEATHGRLGATAAAIGVGVLCFAAPLLVVHLATPRAIGFGDVKLAAVLGAALAMIEPAAGLLALCLATGAAVVASLILRRSEMPLGPGLVVGAAASVTVLAITGEALWPWR